MIKNILNSLLSKEEQLISLQIQKDFFSNKKELAQITQKDIHLINANLLLIGESSIAFNSHKQLINALISCYINSKYQKYSNELKSVFEFNHIEFIKTFDEQTIELIPKLVEELHVIFLNSEFSIINNKLTRKKSKHYLRESGSVYTLQEIANEIVEKNINESIEYGIIAKEITCLDFASGTGRFYFGAIKILNEQYDIPIENVISNNLFAVDIDEIALSILRCKVISFFEILSPVIISSLSTNILNRNALTPKINLLENEKNNINLSNDFKKPLSSGGFDVIFSNPPYYLLKVNNKDDEQKLNGHYLHLQNKIKREIAFFRTSGVYNYSIEGMLNYYQLSIEMILKLLKPNGHAGIICPSSLFADLTSTKLRKHLLNHHQLYFIRYYPESANLFENVAQSTVIFYLKKNHKTDKIKIEINNNLFEIDFDTIKKNFPANYEIPLIDKMGWSILEKISKHKKLKEISFIRNRRGELDLTLYKSFITKNDTGHRLVRGNMISGNEISDKNGEFVDIESFLNNKSEDYLRNDFNKRRLICQQISNVDMQRRLKFIFSEKKDILGNSCNYIVSTRNEEDLFKLHFILNSSLLNWRFKITSSNNHINNYELGELPIIDLDCISVDFLETNEIENGKIMCQLYGLTKDEMNYVLKSSNKSILESIYEPETI